MAAPKDNPPTSRDDAGRFRDAKEGFSIIPPKGYRYDGKTWWEFMSFMGPVEDNFTIHFRVLSRADDGTPMEEAGPKVKKIIGRLLKDYQIVDEGLDTVDGRKAYYAASSYRWEDRVIRSLHYFIRGSKGKVYVVTYSTPDGCFDKYRQSFADSARTAMAD